MTWTCKKCGWPNLMEMKKCHNCGTTRNKNSWNTKELTIGLSTKRK